MKYHIYLTMHGDDWNGPFASEGWIASPDNGCEFVSEDEAHDYSAKEVRLVVDAMLESDKEETELRIVPIV